MGDKDPNPRCCYKPDVITVIKYNRISLESKEKLKIAECPNCGKVKELMNKEIVRIGE